MPSDDVGLLSRAQRLAARNGDALPDAELVARYAENRDPAAFEVLVWRHGPMVWATARRVLRHRHDAEDAFQATFLALARHAATLTRRQAVGGWLHRVATNAALKLRSDRRATQLADEITARGGPADGELVAAVDEELDRLPDRLRTAFVLCCLEGLTSVEAARDLGCPVGTVDSRLHAARRRLRARLARRGFGPGALAGLVVGALPPGLVAATVKGGTESAPPAVAALAGYAGRRTTQGGIAVKVSLSAATAVLALAGAVWAIGASDDTPPRPAAAAGPATGRDLSDTGRIVLWRDGRPVAIAPDAKTVTPLDTEFKGEPGALRVGPDGQSLVYVRNRTTPRPANVSQQDRVYVRGKTGSRQVALSDSPCHAFWGADGVVYGHGFVQPKWGDQEPPPDLTTDFVNWSFDPRTPSGLPLGSSGTKRVLNKLPGNVSVLDRSPDGKAFLALRYEVPPGTAPGARAEARLGLLATASGDFAPLTKYGEVPEDFRFSPDGRSALGLVHRTEKDDLFPVLTAVEVRTGKRVEVAVPTGARVRASCWSPDGKRIAFVWEPAATAANRRPDAGGPETPARATKSVYTVTVANPDGTEPRDVYTEAEYGYGSIDWAPAAPHPTPATGAGPAPAQPGAKSDQPVNGVIVGRLTDAATGRPVGGATVACGAIVNDSGQGGGASGVTDAAGVYRLAVPSPGLYTVWLKKYDGGPGKTAAADDGILVEAGKAAESGLSLVTGRKVVGTVTDADGKPLAGLTVSCNSPARPPSGGPQAATTDGDGAFEFALPPGRATLYVIEPVRQTAGNPFGVGRTASAQVRVPPTGDVAPVTLQLLPGGGKFGDDRWVERSTPGTRVERRVADGSVTGVVVGPDGTAVPGAKVCRDGGQLIASDDKGFFRVDVAKGTQFVMHAWAPGYHVWYGTPTSGDVVRIVLEPKRDPAAAVPGGALEERPRHTGGEPTPAASGRRAVGPGRP